MTEESPERLIASYVPWTTGIGITLGILLFVGLGMMTMSISAWLGIPIMIMGGGLGVGAFLALVQKVQVIFDRPNDAILLRTRSVFGFREETHRLSGLKEVIVEEKRNSDGARLFRAVMVFDEGPDDGQVPIVDSYTNDGTPKKLAHDITRWLAHS